MEIAGFGAGLFLLVIVGILVSLIPFIIASKRGHHYKWIILVLCIFPTGITWLIALIWALWPQNKSLADPIAGNVTGLGERNIGDTAGAVFSGAARTAAMQNPMSLGGTFSTIGKNGDHFDGEMLLSNDAYQLFLVKKFKIEKVDALSKYACQERLFDTSEKALEYADTVEQKELAFLSEAIEAEKKREELLKVEAIARKEKVELEELERENKWAKLQKKLLVAIPAAIVLLIGAYYGYDVYSEFRYRAQQTERYNKMKDAAAKFGLTGANGSEIRWAKDCSVRSYNLYMNDDATKTANWMVMMDPPDHSIKFSATNVYLDHDSLRMIGTVTENTTEDSMRYIVGSPFNMSFQKIGNQIQITNWVIGPVVVASGGRLNGGYGAPTSLQTNCTNSN